MDDSDKVLEEAGLGPASSRTPKTEVVPGFMCDICCEEGDDLQTYAMRCGHRFCVDCYRHYLEHKIKQEGEAARIQCPQDKCHLILDSKSLDLLVTDDLKDRCVYPRHFPLQARLTYSSPIGIEICCCARMSMTRRIWLGARHPTVNMRWNVQSNAATSTA